jgi:hypothetical protein
MQRVVIPRIDAEDRLQHALRAGEVVLPAQNDGLLQQGVQRGGVRRRMVFGHGRGGRGGGDILVS